MIYDSLLLNYGGGIGNISVDAEQRRDRAVVVIGLGGAGTDALRQLKRKLYQQVIPDSPKGSLACYEGIQLLAVDTDLTDLQKQQGKGTLAPEEAFYLHPDSGVRSWNAISENPALNWLERDAWEMSLRSMDGAVRQMGRFRLISNAAKLCEVLENKCRRAMAAQNRPEVDVYIYAGLSGGTGSCFVDVCYLLRHLAKCSRWQIQINGYLFLPDVVNSKAHAMLQNITYYNSNGYAALKELDYLMDLPGANDRFTQYYCRGVQVDTQEPPLDVCNLISATKGDGSMLRNGYEYGISVASDAVLHCLTDWQSPYFTGLRINGHLAPIQRNTVDLPMPYPGKRVYNFLGTSTANLLGDIPDYLAVGFYERAAKAMRKPDMEIPMEEVGVFAHETALNCILTYAALNQGITMVDLPEIRAQDLTKAAKPAKGHLPAQWALAGNEWLDRCNGKTTANMERLLKKPERLPELMAGVQGDSDSLFAGLCCKLGAMCRDVRYGPYYVEKLLRGGKHNLEGFLESEICRVRDKIQSFGNEIQNQLAKLEESKAAFYDSLLMKKRKLEEYRHEAIQYYNDVQAYDTLQKMEKLLLRLLQILKELHLTLIVPLCRTLDTLERTFCENRAYLERKAENTHPGTWDFIPSKRLPSLLDESIQMLPEDAVVDSLVSHLLRNSEMWLTDDKIGEMIRELTYRLFGEQVPQLITHYLNLGWHNAPNPMVQGFRCGVLDPVFSNAQPQLWCDPGSVLSDPRYRYAFSYVDIPSNSGYLGMAAADFNTDTISTHAMIFREIGSGHFLRVLRICGAVPLCECRTVSVLKHCYDLVRNTPSSAGTHLYAVTNRGQDDSGRKDWSAVLPEIVNNG